MLICRLDLNIVTNIVTFADTFANEKPAQNFNGHQCVEPSFSNCGILPGTGLCAFYQFRKTYIERQIDMNIVLTTISFIESCVQRAKMYSPERMAGKSVIFGGVNSTNAYLAATCKCGRACTNKSAMKKKLKFHERDSDSNMPFFPLLFVAHFIM